MMFNGPKVLFDLHKKLIAKAIEELAYEEVLKLNQKNDDWTLDVENGQYFFEAEQSIWSSLWIRPETLKKQSAEGEKKQLLIGEFLRDIQGFCEMSDETLVKYIEEAHQTLAADLILIKKYEAISVNAIHDLNFTQKEQLLLGHPKLIMNKGRIGWGVKELNMYAPESGEHFELVWLAIEKALLLGSEGGSEDYWESLTEIFSKDQVEAWQEEYPNSYIVPVHPWQWNQFIQIQYQAFLATGQMKLLCAPSVKFTPQASIRSLSCQGGIDVKLSLSILNTSCVRGIPTRYLKRGRLVSRRVNEIISNDPKLKSVSLLSEKAAFAFVHPDFANHPQAPYKYSELLGAVFRESIETELKDGQSAMSAACMLLKFKDASYLENLIELSGRTPTEWMKAYFKKIFLPLYHLQLEHGLGYVAHGQNVCIILEDYMPIRLVIKDIHGDLRLAKNSPYLDDAAFSDLERLPAEHMIHDLITGQLITHLRFVSRLLHQSKILKEAKLYNILADIIEEYHEDSSGAAGQKSTLRRETLEKLLVNAVRFKAGYLETPQRLLPMLGTDMPNPIWRGK